MQSKSGIRGSLKVKEEREIMWGFGFRSERAPHLAETDEAPKTTNATKSDYINLGV